MAALRKEWQDFKKSYPEFEKMKGGNANLGPLLDEHEKTCGDLEKKIALLEKKVAEWAVTRDKLIAMHKLYRDVAQDVSAMDKTVLADFDAAWNAPIKLSMPKFLKEKFIPRVVRV